MLLGHMRHNDEIAQLIYILLKHSQIQMGVSGKPFQFSMAPSMKYIKSNWISSVWRFINDLKATIHIEDEWQLNPQRMNDRCLMDIFNSNHLRLQPKEWEK